MYSDLLKADLADVVAGGDGLAQVKLKMGEGGGDAPVAVHGDLAQLGALLIGGAQLLPRGYQGAVVEVDGHLFGRGLDVHLENVHYVLVGKLRGKGHEIVGLSVLVVAVEAAAGLDGVVGKAGVQALLLRLLDKQIHPAGAVLDGVAQVLDVLASVLRNVLNHNHALLFIILVYVSLPYMYI